MSKEELIISRRLKGLMAEHGVTVKELAERTGISVKSLSAKINGRSKWFMHETCSITKEFGFSGIKDVFPELYYSVLTREMGSA